MVTTAAPAHVPLYSCDEKFATVARPVRALLFGEMVRRAAPIMEHYQSDLFHDAMWINENVHGECAFDWSIRPTGTCLSDSPDPATNDVAIAAAAVRYRVELVIERSTWTAIFTRVS